MATASTGKNISHSTRMDHDLNMIYVLINPNTSQRNRKEKKTIPRHVFHIHQLFMLRPGIRTMRFMRRVKIECFKVA